MGNPTTCIKGPLNKIFEYVGPSLDEMQEDQKEQDTERNKKRTQNDLDGFRRLCNYQNEDKTTNFDSEFRRTRFLNSISSCKSAIQKTPNYAQDLLNAGFFPLIKAFSSLSNFLHSSETQNEPVLSFTYKNDKEEVCSFYIAAYQYEQNYLFSLAIYENFTQGNNEFPAIVFSDSRLLPRSNNKRDPENLNIEVINTVSEKTITTALNSALFSKHLQNLLKGGEFSYEYLKAIMSYFPLNQEAKRVNAHELADYVNNLIWRRQKTAQNIVYGFILRHPILTAAAAGLAVALLFTLLVASCGIAAGVAGGLSIGAAATTMVGSTSTLAVAGVGALASGSFAARYFFWRASPSLPKSFSPEPSTEVDKDNLLPV